MVIGVGKPKGAGSEPAPASAPSPEDDYGAELAEMVGVKDAAAFTMALKDFVRACVKSEQAGEYDEAEE